MNLHKLVTYAGAPLTSLTIGAHTANRPSGGWTVAAIAALALAEGYTATVGALHNSTGATDADVLSFALGSSAYDGPAATVAISGANADGTAPMTVVNSTPLAAPKRVVDWAIGSLVGAALGKLLSD